MRADIHDGREQKSSKERPDTLMQDRAARSTKPLAPHGRTIHLGHERSFRPLALGNAVVARQSDDELGKYARLSLDVDPAAVLLNNDVMCHRQAEPCPFPGWFGGKEGIEHLRSHLGRDAGTVVANPDFDRFAEVPGGRTQDRLEGVIIRFGLASYRSIKPIGNKV